MRIMEKKLWENHVIYRIKEKCLKQILHFQFFKYGSTSIYTYTLRKLL